LGFNKKTDAPPLVGHLSFFVFVTSSGEMSNFLMEDLERVLQLEGLEIDL
jgi:hypothetical protein